MLVLAKVCAAYGSIPALRDVSLEVAEGEMVTLIGANGAGKTTTLMTICGAVRRTSGEIFIKGRRIDGMAPHEIAGLGVMLVPEGRRIFAHMTVQENLDMGAYLRGDRAGIRRDMDHVFDLFPILSTRRGQHGGTLSGGEQQMLAISRALMARPRLLLLDEPSLGLAPLAVKRIFEAIRGINVDGRTTIFLVEQNAHLALKVAQRGYVMETGRIAMSDTGANLLSNEAVKTAYLGL